MISSGGVVLRAALSGPKANASLHKHLPRRRHSISLQILHPCRASCYILHVNRVCLAFLLPWYNLGIGETLYLTDHESFHHEPWFLHLPTKEILLSHDTGRCPSKSHSDFPKQTYCSCWQVVLGVVFNPVLDELYVGVKGQGSTLNGRRIQVSETKILLAALFGTEIGVSRDTRTVDAVFARIRALCQKVSRTPQSCSYGPSCRHSDDLTPQTLS